MKHRFALTFSLLFIGWASWPALAYEGWIGTYVYREKVSWSATTEKRYGSHGREEHAEANEYTDVEVRVKACFLGNGSEAVGASVTATYADQHEERCHLKEDYEICCGKERSIRSYAANSREKKEGCDRGPGESEDFTLSIRGSASGEPKINIRNTSLSVREKKGEYRLSVHAEVPTKATRETKGEYNYACSAKKHRAPEPHFREDYHNRTFGETVELKYSGDVITGDHVIFEEGGSHLGRRSFHGGAKFCYPPKKRTDEYNNKQTSRWYFKKVPCFGVIRKAQGDVKMTPASRPPVEGRGEEIIGQEEGVTPGCVTNHAGAKIVTGRQSRLGIDLSDGAQMRIGSNSEIELPQDPCAKGKSKKPFMQHITGLVYYLFGDDEPFEVKANCATGVRGERHPFPGFEPEKAFVMLKDSLIPTAMAEEKEPEEIMPGEQEIKKAKTVFLVDKVPDESLYVKVIKGAIRLQDSSGYTKELKAGQTFMKKWKSPVHPSDLKEIVIKAL